MSEPGPAPAPVQPEDASAGCRMRLARVLAQCTRKTDVTHDEDMRVFTAESEEAGRIHTRLKFTTATDPLEDPDAWEAELRENLT